jgi:hypothetical protein
MSWEQTEPKTTTHGSDQTFRNIPTTISLNKLKLVPSYWPNFVQILRLNAQLRPLGPIGHDFRVLGCSSNTLFNFIAEATALLTLDKAQGQRLPDQLLETFLNSVLTFSKTQEQPPSHDILRETRTRSISSSGRVRGLSLLDASSLLVLLPSDSGPCLTS